MGSFCRARVTEVAFSVYLIVQARDIKIGVLNILRGQVNICRNVSRMMNKNVDSHLAVNRNFKPETSEYDFFLKNVAVSIDTFLHFISGISVISQS